jgi:adenylylsulfate kinase
MSSGAVVWITGRPASGKSTFAAALKSELATRNVPSVVLDSDAVRDIFETHDYSAAGRMLFYTTLSSLAALLARQGILALVAATANRREYRDRARTASPRFLEVYVSTSADECAKRDPKGLYEKAHADAAIELPGLSVPYEPPSAPEVVAEGGLDRRALKEIVELLASRPDNL